jgi:hypothetical protein
MGIARGTAGSVPIDRFKTRRWRAGHGDESGVFSFGQSLCECGHAVRAQNKSWLAVLRATVNSSGTTC